MNSCLFSFFIKKSTKSKNLTIFCYPSVLDIQSSSCLQHTSFLKQWVDKQAFKHSSKPAARKYCRLGQRGQPIQWSATRSLFTLFLLDCLVVMLAFYGSYFSSSSALHIDFSSFLGFDVTSFLRLKLFIVV